MRELSWGVTRAKARIGISGMVRLRRAGALVRGKFELPRGRAMEMIEVDGLRIAYERAGGGPPLVLLHGGVGDGPATWRHQIEGLCGEFTVVAWDAPGVGRSSDPSESFGMAGYADCLAGFVRGLGLSRPHVAGVSFGGALALEFCRRHPAIPRTLILASAYAGWGGSLPADVADQRRQQALMLADLPPDEFAGTLLPTMFSETTPPADVDELAASMRAFHPAGVRAMARACAEDLRGALPYINVPTLLVYGGKDVRAPLAVAEDLHAAISGSALVVLPDTGHACNIEAPEAFNAAVRDFLHTRHNSSPPWLTGPSLPASQPHAG
jgi:pimeloyl-ACP methyl ester carboxylesterase